MTIARSIYGAPSSGRRKLLVLALVAVSVIVVRLIWGMWSERKLDEALAALRARGEPAEVADVVYPDVPEGQNAWAIQLKAISAQDFSVESPRNSNMTYVGYPPYRARWWTMAEASEQAQANAFTLARQSRQLSQVKIRDRLASPLYANFFPPGASGAKSLVNALADGAELAHLKGDDAESLERIFDLLHLNRSLRHDGFLISQLLAMGVDALTCTAVQTIGPGLRFGAPSGAATRPATREQVLRLINALLDDAEPREGIERCVVLERLTYVEICRSRAKGTWFTKPLADHVIMNALDDFELYMKAVRCDDMPAAQRVLDRRWREHAANQSPSAGSSGAATPRVRPRYSRWFSAYDPMITRPVELHFRIIAERRVTAAALAWQLFRADHGRWPLRLEDLVPRYLPHVPADPFQGDGRKIGYVIVKGGLPGGGDRPMLYFDHGNTDPGPPTEPAYGWQNDERRPLHTRRQYRDLARWNPPGQSAAEAVDDQPEEADAPWDEEEPGEEPEEPQP